MNDQTKHNTDTAKRLNDLERQVALLMRHISALSKQLTSAKVKIHQLQVENARLDRAIKRGST